MGPLLKTVQVLLDGIPSFCYVNCMLSLASSGDMLKVCSIPLCHRWRCWNTQVPRWTPGALEAFLAWQLPADPLLYPALSWPLEELGGLAGGDLWKGAGGKYAGLDHYFPPLTRSLQLHTFCPKNSVVCLNGTNTEYGLQWGQSLFQISQSLKEEQKDPSPSGLGLKTEGENGIPGKILSCK